MTDEPKPTFNTLWIPGEPVPQPRHRATSIGGMARLYLPAKHPVNTWKRVIGHYWKFAGFEPLDGPLSVLLQFKLPLPSSAVRKRGNVRKWHSGRGDIDNFTKAVFDALNKIAWHDDGQVSRLEASKHVCGTGDNAGVLVQVTQLKGT